MNHIVSALMPPMLKSFLLIVLISTNIGSILAQELNNSIRLRPGSGNIVPGQNMTLYFPESMIKPESIGHSGTINPLIFKPKLEYDFKWKSQTEVIYTIRGPVIPGQSYKATLAPNLNKLDGTPLNYDQWIDRPFKAHELNVSTKFRLNRSGLGQRPSVPLLFNYKIQFLGARETIYFQDHITRERFEANVFLPTLNTEPKKNDPKAPNVGDSLFVEPAEPLPVNRNIDLVIDGIRDAETETLIPYLKVFPLGKTEPLKLENAETHQDVFGGLEIILRFNQKVDPKGVTDQVMSVEPHVQNLQKIVEGRYVKLRGQFDPQETYKIHSSSKLLGASGYQMDEDTMNEVTFNGLRPSIYFPSTMYFTRSAIGLKMKFLHANTGQTSWRLAKIPEHKIGVARQRLYQTGELLVDQLSLQTIAEGEFPGAPKNESIYRDIEWKPEKKGPLSDGAYLLEVSAPTKSDKLIANRSVIFFTEFLVSQKQTRNELLAKIQKMSDADSVSGLRARLVSSNNTLLGTSISNDEGICYFDRNLLRSVTINNRKTKPSASHLLIDSPGGGTAVAFIDRQTFYNSGWVSSATKNTPRSFIFSDRNLYRPGSSAKFKGMIRLQGGEKLISAVNVPVSWKISEGYSGKTVIEGQTRTDEFGGWETEWQIPKDVKIGSYRLSTNGYGMEYIQVEEYRVPLFEVNITNASEIKGNTAKIAIQSNYFHGAPNSGAIARWSIHWHEEYIPSDIVGMTIDRYSKDPLKKPYLKSAEGEFKLDKNGSGTLELKIPEDEPFSRARYGFEFTVDIVSPEGRTISNGLYAYLQPSDQILGIDLTPIYKEPEPSLELKLATIGPNNQRTGGKEAVIEIFRIESRTVKEEIDPGIFRYRNFNEHIKVASFNNELENNETALNIKVNGKPGRYIAVCHLKGNSLRCSDSVLLAGEARARYPIRSSDGFNISTDKETYRPGETATLAMEAPFGGKAWVSIETDEVIDQFVVDLKNNASKIEIPIRENYFPNAFVTVYLIRPGDKEKIPAERFGRAEINVIREELNLDINVVMEKSQIEPRETSSGTILVTSNGKPIANADLTVMAVDEAVLKLGDWKLPPIIPRFYQERRHNVATYHALDNHIEGFDEEDVTEKGFLIGGGGMDMQQQKKQPRSNFLARAFWMTGLRTDDQGRVAFKFKAPDNLTSFRVTAVGQTKDHKFGKGQAHFEVSKGLMIEPALPRFIRNGDEIVLRAILRQKVMDNAKVLINCKSGKGITNLEKEQYEIGPLNKNVPGTFDLRAKVKKGMSEVTVLFEASILGNTKITDEVEITLPILRPGIMQSTGTYGKVPEDVPEFVFSKTAPKIWEKSEGDFGITFSRSPFLPKFQGLPELLEYPHGCFEQRTSKLLGYIQLADLLQYLPALGQKHINYRSTIEEGIKYIAQNLNSGGFLPYWSGSSSPNSYVTVQAAWLINECKKLNYNIPTGLEKKLLMALDSIVQGRTNDEGDLRAFAVFIDSKFLSNKKPVSSIEELYLNRNLLREESRAFLALAMHAHGIMPEEIQLLASEIGDLSPKEVFDPKNFYSTNRSDAVKYIALSTVSDVQWKEKKEPHFRNQLLSVMDDSRNLSTQENLWLLMSIRSMMEKDNYEPFKKELIKADLISKNLLSVAWKKQPLTSLGTIKIKNDNHPIYYLANASVLRNEENSKREDRGIRIERVIQNLTNPNRAGTPENPLMIGDEVLITYRLLSERDHFFVAVTDELAASLEVVNFNLAQVAAFYSLPQGTEKKRLYLDHSELRDSSARLYFNRLSKGDNTYSLLARVTSAGQFSWPACTITPMYEPRFNGLGNKTTLFVDHK